MDAELKNMLIHLHSHMEACISRLHAVEDRVIVGRDEDIDEMIGRMELYTPINAEDEKNHDESLLRSGFIRHKNGDYITYVEHDYPKSSPSTAEELRKAFEMMTFKD